MAWDDFACCAIKDIKTVSFAHRDANLQPIEVRSEWTHMYQLT